MKFAVLLFSILLTMSAPCMGVSDDMDVVVSHGAAHLVFAHDSENGLDLKPFSGSVTIEHAKILFRKSAGDLTYLVIQIEGPTMLNGGSHPCGAGSEENIVWIKLLSREVVDLRTVLYYSCTFSIDGDGDPVKNDTLEIHYSSYVEDKDFILRYDNKAPELGFVLSMKPHEKEK